ncbi:NTP transferase domain-containing protein [bacterium]|nr:NTP transferase domain-containing protein [bacterium]
MNEAKFTIKDNKNIRYALSKINNFPKNTACLILFVIDKNARIIGSLTDGDIRRGLLKGHTLDDNITSIMKKNFKYLLNYSDYKKFDEYKKNSLKIVPVVSKNFQLIELINLTKIDALLPVDAVIMAGGKGIRLKPYTNDTPKPMLELAGKPIIAHNIDRLIRFGVKNFYISVNHLKEQIINYIEKNYKYTNIKIHFIEENEPLGTIGSLSLVEKFEHKDILVMNADVLTNIDFYDFFINYKDHNDSMSVATFNIRINIPYGILDTTDKKINSLIEKPSFTYYSNAGIYLLKKELIKFIPKNEKYDSTDLMENLIKKRKKISHFPIRGYWLDIGNAQNYAKAQDDIRYIKF